MAIALQMYCIIGEKCYNTNYKLYFKSKEKRAMKRKMIAGVLSTVLAFTMLSTGSVTEVKAKETDAKYYTEGTVTD